MATHDETVTDSTPFPWARSIFTLGAALETIRSVPLHAMIEWYEAGADLPADADLSDPETLEQALRAGMVAGQLDSLKSVRRMLEEIDVHAETAAAQVAAFTRDEESTDG